MSEAGTLALLVALIAAVPPTMVAWATLRRTKQVERNTEVIHDLTNSNLATVKAQLATAVARIEDLERLLKEALTR
jgi:hypothetical protein